MAVSVKNKQIWAKTGGVCAHCGKPANGKNATVDHFIPKSWGGGNDKRNLLPLCRACNMRRMSEEVDAFSFYTYAPPWVLRECLEYRREWEAARKNADGEILDDQPH